MTFALTAEIVAAATATEQVGNPRGQVQHVADGPSLTPTGHLRRGCYPVCGQRARRWTVLDDGDPRPLCARCRSWALRRHPHLGDEPLLRASAEQIAGALRAVTDRGELHRLTYAICRRRDLLVAQVDHPVLRRVRLTALVAEARNSLTAHPTTPARREAPGSRYPRRSR